MPPKEIQLPRKLIQAIEKNKLIVFVGAGLSWELKNEQGEQLEGWKNLVVKILLDLENKGFDVAHLQALIGKYEPVKVLELIELDNGLPRSEIAEFIKKFIHLKKDNDFSLHEKIYQLSNKIITTNYDRAFENAVEELERNTAYKGKNYELATHKNPRASWLFKLHGCYYTVDSMVLFPHQYKELYDTDDINAEHALATLKNVVYNKSVLFIGCGMGDFQINNIFSKIKKIQGFYNQNHFIITKYALDSRLDFLIPLHIKEHNEIPRIIDRLLKEKEKFEQQKTPEIEALEKQVIETKKQLGKTEKELQYITDNVGRMKKLLEREALKYFDRGLEFSLGNQLEKAIDEYEVAVELNPNYHEAFYSWGTALEDLAKTKSDEEAEASYNQAFEKFQKAIEIKLDYHEAFNNWGNALSKLADTKSGEAIETLYYQAFEKFQKAIEIKPDNHEAFYNWGSALMNLAQTKSGIETKNLLKEAFGKSEKAIKIFEKSKYSNSRAEYNRYLALFANVCFLSNRNHEIPDIIEKIKVIPSEFEQMLSVYYHGLLYSLNNVDKEKGVKYIELIEKMLKKHGDKIRGGRHLTFFYNASVFYCLFGQWEEATKWLNKIFTFKRMDDRKDIQFSARFLRFIVMYECEDELENHIWSVTKYLKSYKRYTDINEYIIKSFKDLNKTVNHKEKILIWKNLENYLNSHIQATPPTNFQLGIEELQIWCKAKLQGLTMAEIVRSQL